MISAQPRRRELPSAPFDVYSLSVEQYHEMIRQGIIPPEDRVELLEGSLVAKEGHGPSHAGPIMLAQETIRPLLPPTWFLRIQMPVTLDESEPEPDIAVVCGSIRTFFQRHPEPADSGQLIEVSESSPKEDRHKAVIYARNQMQIYWIINIADERVEVYTDPSGPDALPAYRQRRDYARGDSLPVILEGRTLGHILVDDLLP